MPAPAQPGPFASPCPLLTSDPPLMNLSSFHPASPPLVPEELSARSNGTKSDSASPGPPSTPSDVDPQILEALKGKDRIYVLKLGELMESLINDQRDRISLSPSTSYQRLLVHRCSAYYKLAPENDPVSRSIIVCSTADSRVPPKRLSELVQLESISLPAFKIMRRAQNERKPFKSQYSQTGSNAGDDADLSDIEPSETGSLGGRSNTTGGSGKKWMTMEEREAAYNEARSRIFMDFEEKEKEKERDMSASSSSVSLASGSASTSGIGSSITGDLDDRIHSPVTEGEFLVPQNRDKRGPRHNTSLPRSLRSSAPPFSCNSRNFRPSSPPFSYAPIYDPSQNQICDFSQHPPLAGYPHPQYFYPCPPPGTINPFYPGYPYYPPYNPYLTPQPHSHSQQSASDPSTPSNGDSYVSQPPGPFHHPYGWPHPPIQPPPQMHHHPPVASASHDHNRVGMSPPLTHNPQYPPYIPPAPAPNVYGYPMPCSSQFEPQMEPPASHMLLHDAANALNGNVMGNQVNTPMMNVISIQKPPTNARTSNNFRHANGPNSNGKGCSVPSITDQNRSAWSYGPGATAGPLSSTSSGVTDTVGPRLSSRKQPGNGSTSTASNRSSDEVSSTASSSTTSSSSRQTYTSAASSQHPLPPRPDWAVNLKPQTGPHLKPGRHHEHLFSHRVNQASPSISLNGNSSICTLQTSQQTGLAPLADFPPLTATAEQRFPVAVGAWGKTSTNHLIRSAGPAHSSPNAPTQHSNHKNGINPEFRVDPDCVYEGQFPKSAEFFNPKVFKGAQDPSVHSIEDKGPGESDTMVGRMLLAQVQSINLACQDVGSQQGAVLSNESPSVTVRQ